VGALFFQASSLAQEFRAVRYAAAMLCIWPWRSAHNLLIATLIETWSGSPMPEPSCQWID